jgi:hypothetical protein
VAREMNVNKRIDALKRIMRRTEAHGEKAAKIAAELTKSFKGDNSQKGKRAREAAKAAEKISRSLAQAAATAPV